jgi:hypothetical protein
MLERKRAIQLNPVNVAAEKLRIKQQLQVFLDTGDTEQAREWEAKLAQLEEGQQLARSSKLDDAFALLNERNRQSNFIEGREAEAAASLQRQKKGKARCVFPSGISRLLLKHHPSIMPTPTGNNEEYDPFARRKTKSQYVPSAVASGPAPINNYFLEDYGDSAPLTPGVLDKRAVGMVHVSAEMLTSLDFLDLLDIDGLEVELDGEDEGDGVLVLA